MYVQFIKHIISITHRNNNIILFLGYDIVKHINKFLSAVYILHFRNKLH